MRGKIWTPEHAATLKRMAAAGYTDAEIARHLGFCRETVTRRRLCLGYTAGPKTGRRRLIRYHWIVAPAALYA